MAEEDLNPYPKPQDLTSHPTPESKTVTTHKANCHCGAVRFTVTLDAPFPEYKINKCNCSICDKNGYLLVYPMRKDMVWLRGYETLTSYYFGAKRKAHKFCSVCGTSILIDFKRNEYGETDPHPEKDIIAVNVRTFADIDLDDDDLEWTTFDGRALVHPQYSIDL